MQSELNIVVDKLPPIVGKPRRPEAGVLVRVFDWDDEQMDKEARLLDFVRALVADGWAIGMSLEEIEDFIVESTEGAFADAGVVLMSDATEACGPEFIVTLDPSGA